MWMSGWGRWSRGVALAGGLGGVLAGCAPGSPPSSAAGSGDAVPAGAYALELDAGGAVVSARLELVALDGLPWGRMTVEQGPGQTFAVRGTGRRGGTWHFVVGGPLHGLEIRFGDELTGALLLGGTRRFPLVGHRSGDAVADSLLAHARLEPLAGLSDPTLGESFTTSGPDGTLVYARHGLDLSDPTLMRLAPGDDSPRPLFPAGTHRDRSPFIAPDGSRLLFASDRPLAAGARSEGGFRLWVSTRRGGGWAEPEPLVLSGWSADARQPAVTADGTLYFSSAAAGGLGDGDLYVAEPVAPGAFGPPRNLGEPVNGAADEHGVYPDPEGRWLLFVSAGARPGALGGDDLYIARRDGPGWGTPRNLGMPANSFGNEYGPWLSRDGRHLYFTSDRYGTADIFRIELDRIPALR